MTELVDRNNAIRKTWREVVDLGVPWQRCVNQSGSLGTIPSGEAGGMFVEYRGAGVDGRRAYLKPLKLDPDPWRVRAAREKLAADLAFEIGVSVPPVVLATRNDAVAEERHVSVSLVMYPRQFSWLQLKPLFANQPDEESVRQVFEKIPRAASTALAFDTWIGQTDHNDHPHNVVYGYEPECPTEGEFLFLDYSFALGWGRAWEQSEGTLTTAAPFASEMMRRVDTQILSETIEKIEDLDDEAVRDIVMRLPDSHMVSDQRRTIADVLVRRKAQVRSALLSGGRGA